MKYKAKPTILDGIRFASKGEAMRYAELKFELAIGDISDLKLQPRFPLCVNGIKICTYVADFEYARSGQRIVEDFKGCLTPMFSLKRKWMKAQYGIDILISRRSPKRSRRRR